MSCKIPMNRCQGLPRTINEIRLKPVLKQIKYILNDIF